MKNKELIYGALALGGIILVWVAWAKRQDKLLKEKEALDNDIIEPTEVNNK
jgi:hypothetical protein